MSTKKKLQDLKMQTELLHALTKNITKMSKHTINVFKKDHLGISFDFLFWIVHFLMVSVKLLLQNILNKKQEQIKVEVWEISLKGYGLKLLDN